MIVELHKNQHGYDYAVAKDVPRGLHRVSRMSNSQVEALDSLSSTLANELAKAEDTLSRSMRTVATLKLAIEKIMDNKSVAGSAKVG